MKAFLIARVSTEDQIDALPAQTYRLQEYSKVHQFDSELIEFQESAYSGPREIFRSIVERIQSSEETVAVVFDKIDRYTRDAHSKEAGVLNDLCKRGLVELHFASDSLVVNKDSAAVVHFQLGIGVLTAQYYSNSISDNVKRKQEQMLREGQYLGKAPFGYKNVILENQKRWIEIVPLEAKAVRSMYEWYASGVQSMWTVRQKLIDKFGYTLSKSNLERVLKNPFYFGEMEVKGIRYHHNYVPIITEKLFETAQDVRTGRGLKSSHYAGLPFAYRSMIRCSHCGCQVTFEYKKKKRYIYGHCTQSKGKHEASYVNEDELTNQLMASFKAIQIPEEAYQYVSTEMRKHYEQKNKNRDQDLSMIRAEVEKYDRRIERLYDDHLDNKIPEEMYESKYERFTSSKAVLQKRLKTFELCEKDNYASVLHLLDLSRRAPELFEKANYEQKKVLLNIVHSNFLLEDKLLRWEYKKPFREMALCAINRDWQGRQGSNLRPSVLETGTLPAELRPYVGV